MAKRLTDVTNPLTSQGGNILSPSDWLSRILYVAWFGAIFMFGSKLLQTADKVIPGNITPNDYKSATSITPNSGTVVY